MTSIIKSLNSGRVKGHYRLEVRKVGTNNLKKVREFDNLITDHLLKVYSGKIDVIDMYFVVGTGTTPHKYTDLDLGNQIAYSKANSNSTIVINPTAPDYISARRFSTRFNTGAINNTITEVGITNSGNSRLCSASLILDDKGNPTSITIGADEYLDIFYELYYYPNLEETTGSFELDGNTYQYIAKPYKMNSNAVNGVSSIYNVVASIYDKNAKVEGLEYTYNGLSQKDCTWLSVDENPRKVTYTLELNEGNLTDNLIGGVSLYTYSYSSDGYGKSNITHNTRFIFTPAIPKDNTCSFKFTFELPTFSRYSEP